MRVSTPLVAGKIVLMMIFLADEKESRSWELMRRGSCWRIGYSQQVEKFKCRSSLVILNLRSSISRSFRNFRPVYDVVMHSNRMTGP